jgi:epsin
MDRLESLASTLSQVTLYDVKSMYNQVCLRGVWPARGADGAQAKNMVMNVSEFEGKVMEATNDEPWCVCRPFPCACAGRD